MFSINLFSTQYILVFIFLITFAKLFNLFWFFTFFGTLSLVIWISWLLTNYLRKYIIKEFVNTSRKVVLITGCDTGFGYLTAQTLHKKGIKVLATCLDSNGSGAQVLKQLKIETLEMDVTNEEQIRNTRINVENYLKESKSELWALVNNAGVLAVGPTEWGTINDLKRVINVNVIGLTQVTRQFLPLIRANSSGGRIVNMASCAGRFTVPGMAFYSMSKHAVIAFSDALRREMRQWNIKVITIEPESYKTPMSEEDKIMYLLEDLWERTAQDIKSDYGGNYFHAFKDRALGIVRTARPQTQEVVNAIVSAITEVEPKSRYTCSGPMYAIYWWLLEIFPNELTDKIFDLITIFSVKPRALDSD